MPVPPSHRGTHLEKPLLYCGYNKFRNNLVFSFGSLTVWQLIWPVKSLWAGVIGKYTPLSQTIPPLILTAWDLKLYLKGCTFVEGYFPIFYILCYNSDFGSLLTKKLHGTFKIVMVLYTIASVSEHHRLQMRQFLHFSMIPLTKYLQNTQVEWTWPVPNKECQELSLKIHTQMKFSGSCWAQWEQFFIYLYFNCTIASIDTYLVLLWQKDQMPKLKTQKYLNKYITSLPPYHLVLGVNGMPFSYFGWLP